MQNHADRTDAAATPGDTDPSALDIKNLTVSYRRRGRLLRVINDVSFHIKPGEAYGLVGESGCGKSTVAMTVMRYLPMNAIVETGSIGLFGSDDLLQLSAARLRELRGNRLAMVYQDPGSALNPAMTIGRQIAEVYRYHRNMNKAQAMHAAELMLQRVQISDPGRVARRYPHQLSGGQQQRIMFAMAFAVEPKMLVLDEPTTGLDATVEAEILDLVAQLRREFDTAILFISHNLGIVARTCERVGILYAGRLIEEGPSSELFSDPQHPYTSALLRCVPRTGMRKDLQRLDAIQGSLPMLGSSPAGCIYAERCPLVQARCRVESPPVFRVNPSHMTRCFFHEEVRKTATGEKRAPSGDCCEVGRPLLQVEDVDKVYRVGGSETLAVSGVSLDVNRGETLGIVGESGSGKSSLAKCIAGLAGLSGGRIVFDDDLLVDTAVKRSREQRRKLQLIFQNPDTSLNPRHTVRHILKRAIRLLSPGLSASDAEQRLLALASAVRLQPRQLDMRPGALSGGLKQRVAVARAFAGSPSLVVCDEPTSALDVSVQAAILNLLVDLQEDERVSYIFISHDLGVVRYLADRIAVMYLAQLVEIGPSAAVFDPPHHPYTEALLSAMPTLDPSEQRARIKLGGPVPSPSNPPAGCRFHTRCPRVLGEICRREAPPWQNDGEGHVYRCHIPPAELRAMQMADPDRPADES